MAINFKGQLYGYTTRDREGNSIGVYTMKDSEGVHTEIVRLETEIKLICKRTMEDIEKDRGLESFKRHIKDINEILGMYGSTGEVRLDEFLACIVSQLI